TPCASRSRDSTFSHSRWGGTRATTGSAASPETETGDASLIPRLSQDCGLFFQTLRAASQLSVCTSARRQLARRVDGLALLADLEVQLDAVGVSGTHFGDLLALAHGLVFLDQQRLVVGVGRQVITAVLDDDEVAVATQARTGVDHAAIAGGHDRVTGL